MAGTDAAAGVCRMYISLLLGVRIRVRPLTGAGVISRAVALVEIRNLGHEGIRRVCVCEKTQNAQEYLGDRQCGAPLTFQNIKADTACCVDIRMIDLRVECDDGGLERIIRGEVD